MKKIALLTSEKHSQLIPDDRRLLSLASEFGVQFTAVVWDQSTDWKSFDAVVVRTPWDYVEKKEKFVAVLQEIEKHSRLLNPLKTLIWNFDKRYLLELQALGLPVPQTVIIDPKAPIQSVAALTGEIVIKPVISAGGFATYRVAQTDINQFNWNSLPWDSHVFMAQEFLEAILTEGEYSFLFFGNEFSHALRKTPTGGEFRVQDDHGGRVHSFTPSERDILEAQAIVKALPVEQSYCRVDLARHPSGKLQIMEIELIEPELFFRMSDGGEEKFIRAILRELT